MAFENLKSTGIRYVLEKLKDVFVQIRDAVRSVNGEEPDENGNITLTSVPFAQNLESESTHINDGTFIQRMAGGDGSISDSGAWLMNIKGNNIHDGYVAESIEHEDPEGLTVTIDRDTFVEAATESDTYTFSYTSSWSPDIATYGISVTGTPTDGDTITVQYVKEVPGTITVADPRRFAATGWNLYNHTGKYARVAKYEHGYRIEGAYSTIKFSTTVDGDQSDIIVNDGNFNIPADGFVHLTGGNSTTTAIYATWDDWTDGYPGDFEPYTQSVVKMDTVMTENFPYGLMKAGTVVDEIDLNLGQAISRVERMANNAENMETAKESGREFEYDENYIYLARAVPVTVAISVDGSFTANDHGVEFFNNTGVPVVTQMIYGNNLKNKLERDVLTMSQQTLTDSQKAQARSNIAAADAGNAPDFKISTSSFSSGSKTFTLDTNKVYMMVAVSGNATHSGLWIARAAGQSVALFQVYKGNNITAETSGMDVTFTLNPSRNTQITAIRLDSF